MRVYTRIMSDPCYCIVLRRASRRLTAIYDAALAPLGVNLAQFSLLRTIRRTEPVSLTRLGHETELDRSTVGRNVRVLEGHGPGLRRCGRPPRVDGDAVRPGQDAA